jgi:hypothetical protein
MEGRRELGSIELRIVSRPRNRADVDHALDAVCLQQPDEVLYRACRVADCEDDMRFHVTSGSTESVVEFSSRVPHA